MSGEELKEFLYEKKITQAELALKMGMSTQSMSQALKAVDLKSGFLEKVAKVLGVDMSFLYNSKNGTTITTVTTGDNNKGNITTGACSGNSICGGPSEKDCVEIIESLKQQVEKLETERGRLMKWIDKLLEINDV